MLRRRCICACLVLGAVPASFAEGLTMSGGLDVRATSSNETDLVLEGAFLNFRQVFTQGGADRWIVVLQADSGDNFESPHLYQTYVQLKGPLGRWNVRAGRLIVPFGLLANYDSERLVLNTLEPLTLGVKLDQGLQLHGFTADVDYAFAVTRGIRDHDAIVTGRLGRTFGPLQLGVSVLTGTLPEVASKESVEVPGRVLSNVPLVDKRRLGVDTTLEAGPGLWRAEAVAGTDGGSFVKGAYAEYEHALDARWSVTINGGVWEGEDRRWRYGTALARDFGAGRWLRMGYVDEREPEGRDHALVVQFYWEFSRAL